MDEVLSPATGDPGASTATLAVGVRASALRRLATAAAVVGRIGQA